MPSTSISCWICQGMRENRQLGDFDTVLPCKGGNIMVETPPSMKRIALRKRESCDPHCFLPSSLPTTVPHLLSISSGLATSGPLQSPLPGSVPIRWPQAIQQCWTGWAQATAETDIRHQYIWAHKNYFKEPFLKLHLAWGSPTYYVWKPKVIV